jgi:23S rRNA (adenine2503-C2)-methyltransferase
LKKSLDIKSLSLTELEEFVQNELGEKKFRAGQIAHWVMNRNAECFDEMDNIPASLREKLNDTTKLRVLTKISQDISSDGTVKWLYKTFDGYYIETVLIPTLERNSVCISTQVGCAMDCKFCRTAKMGLKRHLEVGEILEQFIETRKFVRSERGGELTNLIFMGMGEPLHNYQNLKGSIVWLHHQKFFNLARKRITVSTSGVVPNIRKMAEEEIPAALAISLNGTNDIMRKSIMPITDRYPMNELLDSVDFYMEKTGRPVTFEFVLIQGITCTDQGARELVEICKARDVKVNAICLNDSDDPELKAPTPQEVERFFSIVRQGKQMITLRQPRGRDIKAACGQLAVHKENAA